jgi:hypothetical protein
LKTIWITFLAAAAGVLGAALGTQLLAGIRLLPEPVMAFLFRLAPTDRAVWPISVALFLVAAGCSWFAYRLTVASPFYGCKTVEEMSRRMARLEAKKIDRDT